MRTCKVGGCDRPHYGRGFCSKHWTRWYRYGDPMFVSPHPKNTQLPTGEAAYRSIKRNYKNRARRLGLEWSLKEHQIRFLTSSDCFYCGQPPSKVKGGDEYNGSYVFNGIDRIDNDKGYTWENCVTACTTCNMKKKAMNYADFYNWIMRVAENMPQVYLGKEQWECT